MLAIIALYGSAHLALGFSTLLVLYLQSAIVYYDFWSVTPFRCIVADDSGGWDMGSLGALGTFLSTTFDIGATALHLVGFNYSVLETLSAAEGWIGWTGPIVRIASWGGSLAVGWALAVLVIRSGVLNSFRGQVTIGFTVVVGGAVAVLGVAGGC